MKWLKSTVLLMGPVLLIGAVGVYRTRMQDVSRTSLPDDSGPVRIEVKSFAMEPITPREVELGFDAKAVVRYQLAGRPSASTQVRTIAESSGPEKLMLAGSTGRTWSEDKWASRSRFWGQSLFGLDDRTVILMRLADWGKDESVSIHGTLFGQLEYISPSGVRGKAVAPRKSISLEVKKRGVQHIRPVVSRYCPLRLVKYEWIQDKLQRYPDKCQLRVVVRDAVEPEHASKARFDVPYFQTVDGRKIYELYKPGIVKMFAQPFSLLEKTTKEEQDIYYRMSKSVLHQLGPGKLILKVSSDDSWPLTIKVPVDKIS